MFQNQLHLSFKRIDIWIWVFKINVKIGQHGSTTDNVRPPRCSSIWRRGISRYMWTTWWDNRQRPPRCSSIWGRGRIQLIDIASAGGSCGTVSFSRIDVLFVSSTRVSSSGGRSWARSLLSTSSSKMSLTSFNSIWAPSASSSFPSGSESLCRLLSYIHS